MSDDPTKTQVQDSDDRQRTRSLSLTASDTPPGPVDGYDPVRRLGHGAYGEVWLAVSRSNPGQQVAIKYYTHRGSDWSLLAREVEKLNFLATDSHVVQLLAVNTEAQPPYYVMQYFENGSLGQWLEGARLGVGDAVALFREIVIALVQAHNRGVLHCDLKPDNVLLAKDFKPRLADFGQSRLAGETAPTLGTLFYMPPEQVDLTAAPDARWDVYALGAILFTMLTGCAPYRTPEAEAHVRGAANLLQQLERYRQLLLTAPKPTAHRRVPGIDRRLIDVVERCLAVDPHKRFANAQAVLDALDARSLALARRPLYWLTTAVALLALAALGVLAVVLFQTALSHASATLTGQVLESNRFAAEFGAAAAAREIELRWRLLQVVADDETFQRLHAAATREADTTGPDHQVLQQYLDETMRGLSRALNRKPDSLFVTDAVGEQLARSPLIRGRTIGNNYSHRDYFHGLGEDFERGQRETTPIWDVHLSVVYKSEADKKPRVSFTVPIWGEGPLAKPVRGVLGMSVEPGHFIELQPPGEEGAQVAVLIDGRPDEMSPGQRGLILQHPALDGYWATNPDVPPRRVADVAVLRTTPPVLRAWRDPFALQEGDWLAAWARVVVPGHDAQVAETGWVVLVEQPASTALAPVAELRDRLLTRGLVTLGGVGLALGGLVLFLAWALNESGRSPLHRFLRRRAGLDSLSTGRPTPLLPLTIKAPIKTIPFSR